MAVFNSSLMGNSARGKIGNMILKHVPGVQGVVGSEYQPNVANPATQGQIQQRTQQGSAAILVSALYTGFIPQFYKFPAELRSYVAAVVQDIRSFQLDIVPAPDLVGIAGYGFVTDANALANAPWKLTLGNMLADTFDTSPAQSQVDINDASGNRTYGLVTSWLTTPRPNTVETAEDNLYWLFIDVVTGSSAVIETGVTRVDGNYNDSVTNPVGNAAQVGTHPVIIAPFFARLDPVTGTLNVSTQYRWAVATGTDADVLPFPSFNPTATGTGRTFTGPAVGSVIRG